MRCIYCFTGQIYRSTGCIYSFIGPIYRLPFLATIGKKLGKKVELVTSWVKVEL